MEPHAVVAEWNGDSVTLDMPNQALVLSRATYAAYFGIPAENVLIRSPFLAAASARRPSSTDRRSWRYWRRACSAVPSNLC